MQIQFSAHQDFSLKIFSNFLFLIFLFFPKCYRRGCRTTNCPTPAPSHRLSYVPSYPTLSCFWAGVKRRKRRKFRVGFRKFAYRFLIFCQPADFNRGRMDLPSSSQGRKQKREDGEGEEGTGRCCEKMQNSWFSFLFLFLWWRRRQATYSPRPPFLSHVKDISSHPNFSFFPFPSSYTTPPVASTPTPSPIPTSPYQATRPLTSKTFRSTSFTSLSNSAATRTFESIPNRKNRSHRSPSTTPFSGT